MKANDPCPHCGRLYSSTLRFVPGKDPGDMPIRIHDIEDHDCPKFRVEPSLLPVDPAFKVDPSRSEAEMAYALDRYRRAIKR